jgi:hypothetical protein
MEVQEASELTMSCGKGERRTVHLQDAKPRPSPQKREARLRPLRLCPLPLYDATVKPARSGQIRRSVVGRIGFADSAHLSWLKPMLCKHTPGVELKNRAPGVGTPQDMLAKYGLATHG